MSAKNDSESRVNKSFDSTQQPNISEQAGSIAPQQTSDSSAPQQAQQSNIPSQPSNQASVQQVSQSQQQTYYIGKVIISKDTPAKHNEFWVWTKSHIDIEVGSSFVIVEDPSASNRKYIVGLVVDSMTMSTSENGIAEYFSSGVGEPLINPPIEPRVITFYKVRVISREPSITKPAESRMLVRLASQNDIDRLNSIIKPEYRVLAGFLYNFTNPLDSNSWIPIYFDSTYLAGKQGAHVMITGKTGLATKTSYALFLIPNFLQHAKMNNKRVAAVLFDVKQCDLFNLHNLLLYKDWDSLYSTIKNLFGNRTDLAEYNIGMWKRIKELYNLSKPSDLIPKDSSGRPMLYYYTYAGDNICSSQISNAANILLQQTIPTYSYGLMDLGIPELITALSNGKYDTMSEPQRVAISLLARKVIPELKEEISFDKLLNDANKQRSIFMKLLTNNVDERTVPVIIRYLIDFVGTNRNIGLELQNAHGNPIKDTNIHEGINIIQLNGLSDTMQNIVFSSVLRTLMNIQQDQNNNRRFDYIIVFVDELNKFAPKRGESPIKDLIVDIAARARSLNIGLIGAQQFASRIETQVYGNASTYVVGNTDAAELKEDEYKAFSDFKDMIYQLQKGQMVIYQPSTFISPIKIRFPVIPYDVS
ncbi:ATP-binding protein [Sulfolobus acidocaldarius]|uniref:Helicase HerA central domain-containing protein n=3 Tax=Sulfolobus acidocaldarius TaxID=2285 RepID=A0A0U3GLF6_9CREN|nr:DUF87 domain-containing protein [Sulfolobus acidocaldarius]AGE70440.1 hypothetical protein SacN8_02300 [Sulfolobus acidocaldarius N8]AGE72714.1 hypothetical protein SacRon12I_02295 [Sulfolobus acidocaldarius Ron12/I]ALU29176.1 hypothetical protein ATY89_03965 [Sulfolobus acidocaldarius]ALU31902.1 hypothetical protein ATZ20_06990 [Sulfolobus acidocaldarius]